MAAPPLVPASEWRETMTKHLASVKAASYRKRVRDTENTDSWSAAPTPERVLWEAGMVLAVILGLVVLCNLLLLATGAIPS
jgi:hypothetical protein